MRLDRPQEFQRREGREPKVPCSPHQTIIHGLQAVRVRDIRAQAAVFVVGDVRPDRADAGVGARAALAPDREAGLAAAVVSPGQIDFRRGSGSGRQPAR